MYVFVSVCVFICSRGHTGQGTVWTARWGLTHSLAAVVSVVPGRSRVGAVERVTSVTFPRGETGVICHQGASEAVHPKSTVAAE